MTPKILDRAEAVEYIWQNSNEIRSWYLTEHGFDLDNYSRCDYRTFGSGYPGDIISEIIADGIKDGLIRENDDGDYEVTE